MPKTPGGKRLKGAGRVSFLARIEQVRSEVNEGWPLVAIFDRHKADLGVLSYSQFTRYVKRYVTGSEDDGPKSKDQSETPATRPAQDGRAGSRATPETPRQPSKKEGGISKPGDAKRFRYDPLADDKDDLI